MANETSEAPNRTYLGRFMLKTDVLRIHDIQQDLEGDDQIGIDDCTCLAPFILGKATGMNDAHLLDNGRFPRFSRT